MSLKIENLTVKINDLEVISNVSLEIKDGEIIVLMGPNGSGKSTLANALMGSSKYKVTNGAIILDEKNITTKPVDQRAKAGLFLSFQHPEEIDGLQVKQFLRSAYDSKNNSKTHPNAFNEALKQKALILKMPLELLERNLNFGFSGGEKKQLETLQMTLLEPKYAILDEIDSGLDVDALRTIANSIKLLQEKQHTGILLITHYARILKYLKPNHVLVMKKGRVVQKGGFELAQKIEQQGYMEEIQIELK